MGKIRLGYLWTISVDVLAVSGWMINDSLIA